MIATNSVEKNVEETQENIGLDTFFGKERDLSYLKEIPTPTPTKTFSPIGHHEFVQLIIETAGRMLHGYKLTQISTWTSSKDQRLFGKLTYQKNDGEDVSFAIGFRQALDKSMAAGLALGGSVYVCSNMIISGKELVFRKHTGDIQTALKEKIVLSLLDANDTYHTINSFYRDMKEKEVTDDTAFSSFGLAYGKGLLTPNLFTRAVSEWEDPTYYHGPKTAWRWYNSMTQVYKALPHNKTIALHSEVHDFAKQQFLSN